MKLSGLMGAAVGMLGVVASAQAVSVDVCDDIVVGPESTIIETPRQGGGPNAGVPNQFQITLVSVVGDTFTYKAETLGQSQDLSHFVLGLEDCLDFVIDETAGAEFGKDGNRPFSGLKWNDEGTFSFTLDTDWTMGTIEVLVFSAGNYAIGEVRGPQCCGVTVVPTPAAAGMGLALLGLGVLRRGRRLA